MNIYIISIVILAALLLIGFVFRGWRKKQAMREQVRKSAHSQQLTRIEEARQAYAKFVEEVEATDNIKTLAEIARPTELELTAHYCFECPEIVDLGVSKQQIDHAEAKCYQAHKQRRRLNDLERDLRGATSEGELALYYLRALCAGLADYIDALANQSSSAEEIIFSYYQRSMLATQTGNLTELRGMQMLVRGAKNNGYSSELTGNICFPDDWNDIVTRYIEAPMLGDFTGLSNDPQPGVVRLLAAEALRSRSLKQAKIVLAYCNIRHDVTGSSGYDGRGGVSRQAIWPYRAEIGDVLLADVTKMVHVIHTEHNMFV